MKCYQFCSIQSTVKVYDVYADSLDIAKIRFEVGPLCKVEQKEGIELVDVKYTEERSFLCEKRSNDDLNGEQND
jgi:hypothetical protein